MTENIEPRTPVSVPEKEATAVTPLIRNAIPGVGVSVYGAISKKGERIIEVLADDPNGDDRFKRVYLADAEPKKVVKHAVSAIKTQFAM